MYTIRLPKGHCFGSCQGTVVLDESGEEIPLVVAIDIKVRPSSVLWASIFSANPENPERRFFFEGPAYLEVV